MRIPQEHAASILQTPLPDWVIDRPVDLNSLPSDEERTRGGIWNLLSDVQHNLEERIYYAKTIRKLATESGVQHGSRLHIDFSPHIHQLHIHSLILHRNQESTNLLATQEIQVLNREEGLEYDMFGGYLMAVLLLNNTRVGDIIEFSHSVRSLDTLVTDRSSGTFVLKGGMTSKSARWRLVYAQNRQVFASSHNHDIQPTVSYTESGLIDCQWEVTDQRPLMVEPHRPSWHMPLHLVEYGEYSSWNEVAQWCCRLFYAPSEFPPEFHEIVQNILQNAPSFHERVRQALRFVQDDIRYVSLSVGEHSYKPYDIATILERRYGDCKDKSCLLSALLRAMGIDALPALVHSVRKQQIAQSLPSPHRFNHVITKVSHEGRTYWYDATIQGQRGPSDKIYCPAYGKALVIYPDTQNLEDVVSPGARNSTLKIIESFKIHQNHDSDEFSVSRVYEGHCADGMRKRIANSSHEQIAREVCKSYQALYPHINAACPWTFRDDETNNRLEVSFEFHVNKLWHPLARQPGMCVANFFASGIYYIVNAPPAGVRKTPYAIAHPNNIENELIIRTTRPLRLARAHALVECEAFRYKCQRDVVSNALHFNMQYTSNKDHVLPAEMPDFIKATNQVAQHARQNVILNIPANRHRKPVHQQRSHG